MRLIIISGLSGSGKSVALHVLEDLGYYSIDNLPAALLESLVEELTRGDEPQADRIAVGIDARNPQEGIAALPALIQDLRQNGVHTEVLFLQADDDVLLKRYSESRRRHPLADAEVNLRSAIAQERELLAEIINAADLTIDTTRSSVYDLGDVIRQRIDRRPSQKLSVMIESFGFKHGIPADADFVFDLRCLPNPYWQPQLRPLTGLDAPVAEFLDADSLFEAMFKDIYTFLSSWIPNYLAAERSYLTIGVGCTGGQHRSVRMTERLAEALRAIHDPVLTRHSELTTKT